MHTHLFDTCNKASHTLGATNKSNIASKGPFTNTCKGGDLMQKIFIAKIFRPPPFRPQKNQGPLFAMKIMGQPHRKACKLNF